MRGPASVTRALLLGLGALAPLAGWGEEPAAGTLDLAQAEAIAVGNQPRLLAAQLRSRALAARSREARAAFLPTLAGNLTAVKAAEVGTTISSGALSTSSISSRFAYGASLSQLVTDFGRTGALFDSARFSAQAQAQAATLTRAQVRLNVREAYFRVLGAEAVLTTAQAAWHSRQLVARQIAAMAQSQLRSSLDVSLAEALTSEAELAVLRAETSVAQERAALARAMGADKPAAAALAETALPDSPLAADPESLLADAQARRADLGAALDQAQAARQFALAEQRLNRPTLNLLAAAGQAPDHDRAIHRDYAAAGLNLSIPLLDGGRFAARATEAQLEAKARDRDADELRLQVAEEVRDGWYLAREAYRSLDVAARLARQTQAALRLAQNRYDSGLGGIVELNESQLAETSAEIGEADAKYTYLTRRAQLDFATGRLN